MLELNNDEQNLEATTNNDDCSSSTLSKNEIEGQQESSKEEKKSEKAAPNLLINPPLPALPNLGPEAVDDTASESTNPNPRHQIRKACVGQNFKLSRMLYIQRPHDPGLCEFQLLG